MTSWVADAWMDIPPKQGHYKLRRPPAYNGEHWSQREWQAVYVWYGPPPDPETGLPLDRAPRWQATLGGDLVDISEVWPWCARNELSETEYEELLNANLVG